MFRECYDCLFKQAGRLMDKFEISSPKDRDYIQNNLLEFIKENNYETLPAPIAARVYYKMIQDITGVDDFFKKEKDYYNKLILDRYDSFKNDVYRSENPYLSALKYAVAGNIIDFGPPDSFDVEKTISEALTKTPKIDDSVELKNEIEKADKILYLGDNCGEIVMDKLFIEFIGKSNITFAVRGGNTINDATIENAKDVDIDKYAKLISNGFDAPSTILSSCSSEFLDEYNSADLIISKGQGNLEGLYTEKNKNIFFLLMAKCETVANMLGVSKGDVVIVKNTKLNV